MRYVFILIFLLLATITCASDFKDDSPVYVQDCNVRPTKEECMLNIIIRADNSYSPIKQELVYQGIAAWSVRTGNTLNARIIVTSELFDDLEQLETISIFNRDPGVGYAGWAEWRAEFRSAKIYMSDNLEDEMFLSVLKHELGHAFDLQHYTGPYNSIMNVTTSPGKDISCQDIKNYCKRWQCAVDCVPASKEVTYTDSVTDCGILFEKSERPGPLDPSLPTSH